MNKPVDTPTKNVIIRAPTIEDDMALKAKQHDARPTAPIGTMPNSMLRPERRPARIPPNPMPRAAIGKR